MTFSALDIGIVLVYLTVCFGAGVYARKFVGDVADFLVAGRALGLHLGVATLAATEIGTITFMYYAELGYKSGFSPFITALISGVVFIFIGRTGFVEGREEGDLPGGPRAWEPAGRGSTGPQATSAGECRAVCVCVLNRRRPSSPC